jgi:hypothetical protein
MVYGARSPAPAPPGRRSPAPLSSVERVFAGLLGDWQLVALASVLIVGLTLAATISKSPTPLELSVQSEGLWLISAGGPERRPLEIGFEVPDAIRVSAENLATVELASSSCDTEIKRRGLRLEGERINVTRLRLSDGTKIYLTETEDNEIELWLSDHPASIDMGIGANVVVNDGHGAPVACASTSEPETRLVRMTSDVAPTRIILSLPKGQGAARLTGLHVTGLGFGREIASGPARPAFASTIIKGSVHLLDGRENIELKKGDWLTLDHLNATLRELKIDGSAPEINLVGTVGKVKIGPEGFTQDRTPTWLAWIMRNHSDKGIWAIAVGLLGGLWRLRQWARKQHLN